MDKEIKKQNKKKIKRFLIIGGDGFIGSRLAKELKANGENFLATSKREKKTKKIYFDLLKTKKINFLKNYDAVFICAGMTSYEKCEAQKRLSRKINVTGLKRLIQKLRKKAAFVVYYSSSCVYTGKKKYHKETDIVAPRSEYSRQKMIIEKYIQKNLKNYAIIRAGKVVDKCFPILHKWHAQIIKNEPVTAYSDFTLSPILRDDLVKISLKIAKEKINGIFNISALSELSYYTFAKIFCKKMNFKTITIKKLKASENLALRSIVKRHSVLNTKKLRKKTGVKLMDAKTAVKKILCNFKDSYNKEA